MAEINSRQVRSGQAERKVR